MFIPALNLAPVFRFALCFGLSLAATSAWCQSDTATRHEVPFFLPAITLENPINSGKLGQVVVGGIIQDKTRLDRQPDANAGVYVSLGEPEKFVGGGITINIYGMTNHIGEQNNLGQGSANLHINKLVWNKRLLLDLGLDNAFLWGGNRAIYHHISYQRSWYLSGNYIAYTRPVNSFKFFGYLSITAGAGNGYFRSDYNFSEGKRGPLNPYLSLATPVVKGTNFIAEWNGYDIGLGIASIPYQKLPLMLLLEVTDLRFGVPRYVASFSYPFLFGKKNNAPAIQTRTIRGIRPVRTLL